jgi:hypothetical protein
MEFPTSPLARDAEKAGEGRAMRLPREQLARVFTGAAEKPPPTPPDSQDWRRERGNFSVPLDI